MKAKKSIFFFQILGEKICIPLMTDAQKLARTCSMLGPKIQAHARARSCLGFQCSYSLGAWYFDARPIPRLSAPDLTNTCPHQLANM